MEANFAYCRQLVSEADRDRFLATLFAPEQHRDALHALYAFNVEIGRVRELARQPMPGEIRLQWWREVLGGARPGEGAANPVAGALGVVMARHDIPVSPLLALVDAHEFDLYDEPMQSIASLEQYAQAGEGRVFALAAKVLGQASATIDQVTRSAGIAWSIAGILRDFPRHAARGQIFLPAEVLNRFGATPDDIRAGRATPELRAALAEMRLRTRRHLDAAREQIRQVPVEVLPALLPAALVKPALARMERADYAPFQPNEIPRWRRQWILWRAARNGKLFG